MWKSHWMWCFFLCENSTLLQDIDCQSPTRPRWCKGHHSQRVQRLSSPAKIPDAAPVTRPGANSQSQWFRSWGRDTHLKPKLTKWSQKKTAENLQQKLLRDPGKTPEMMNLSRKSWSSTSSSLSTAVIFLFGEKRLYSTQCWWKTKLQNTIIDIKKSIIGGIQPFVTLRWKKKKCGSWNPSKDLGLAIGILSVWYDPSGQTTIISMGCKVKKLQKQGWNMNRKWHSYHLQLDLKIHPLGSSEWDYFHRQDPPYLNSLSFS